MINKFINAKSRDNKAYKDFFKYLQNFSNEEKCSIITEVAENLIEKGGKENIFSAETILVHATQQYMNDISDTNYKALVYFRLGQLYELHIESFIKAYTYYEKYALNNTINEGSHAILLRALTEVCGRTAHVVNIALKVGHLGNHLSFSENALLAS